MKFSVTKAGLSDARDILNIGKQTWLSTYPNKEYKITKKLLLQMRLDSVKRLKRMNRRIGIADGNHYFWVTRHKKRAVGYLYAIKKKHYNYLASFYILPQYQNLGLGKKMFKLALKWFGNRKKISLVTAVYNYRAIAFYKKFGFSIGRRCFGPRLPDGRRAPSLTMHIKV